MNTLKVISNLIALIFFANTALAPLAIANEKQQVEREIQDSLRQAVTKLENVKSVGAIMTALKFKLPASTFAKLEMLVKKNKISNNEPLSFKKGKDGSIDLLTNEAPINFDFSAIRSGVIDLNGSKIVLGKEMTFDGLMKAIDFATQKKEISLRHPLTNFLISEAHADFNSGLSTAFGVIVALGLVALAVTMPWVLILGSSSLLLAKVVISNINQKNIQNQQIESEKQAALSKEYYESMCKAGLLHIKEKNSGAFKIDGNFILQAEYKTYHGTIKQDANGNITSITVDGKKVKLPSTSLKLSLPTQEVVENCSSSYKLSLTSKKIVAPTAPVPKKGMLQKTGRAI